MYSGEITLVNTPEKHTKRDYDISDTVILTPWRMSPLHRRTDDTVGVISSRLLSSSVGKAFSPSLRHFRILTARSPAWADVDPGECRQW